MCFGTRKGGLPKIEELEKIADPDDRPIRQFILRSKVLLGKIENGQIVPYTNDEKLDMLFEAIRLTSPNFDIDAICDGLYSVDEVKVINQIALIYSQLEQREKVIDIYRQLLAYIENHFQNTGQFGSLFSLVAFNYVRELDLVGRYTEAIEIAEIGWKACVQHKQYRMLPSIIAGIAECYHFLGEDDKSKDYYLQALYLCKAINDEECLSTVLYEIKEYFGDDFSF